MRVEQVEKRFSTDQLMTGVELPTWLDILRGNRFQVDPYYFHRLLWLTALAIPVTLLGRLEEAVYGRRVARTEIRHPPIFVLGHWRTGTTHLQNLLMRDPNHTAPTIYQVVFPTAFLLTGRVVPTITKGMLAETRGYDNVKQGWDEAAEDEIALAKLTGKSIYCGFMFPELAHKYAKYVDFLGCTDDERELFGAELVQLVKKITLATGKRVVLKSPAHTARIPLLLKLFPDACFIHIHRNPYETFASTLHLRNVVDPDNYLQRPDTSYVKQRWEQTAALGHKLYERIIADRSLIPAENYMEVAYDDFVGRERDHLRAIYRRFRLPGWEEYERTIAPYLRSLDTYKKNELEISDDLKKFVFERWRIVFDAYGYGKEYPCREHA